ncbi:MAG: hypothetical protein OXQ86_05185 [Gammaproteobacteria bacterium]|nr:hypothetical protein [Gammaproteobacteria bacterium]MDE0413569.1 hypothetical protein [Gammaproteobacteria bacterium]
MWRISAAAYFVVVHDRGGEFIHFAQRNGGVTRQALGPFGGLARRNQFVAQRGYLVAQRPGFLGAAFGLGSGGLAQLLHLKPYGGDFVAQDGSVTGSTSDFLVRGVAHGPHVLAQGGDVVTEITGLVKGAFEFGHHRRAPIVRRRSCFGLFGIVRTAAPRRDQHECSKRNGRVSVQLAHDLQYSPGISPGCL